ncbi:hypothetical protein B484DRAFT_308486, partial [Ochromonadaceae sp. CCMP2298]
TVHLHEQGFAAIFSLMAGDPVSCPLCLSDSCVRPTVTSCSHVYCYSCVGDVLERDRQTGRDSKCPVCRRGVSAATLM